MPVLVWERGKHGGFRDDFRLALERARDQAYRLGHFEVEARHILLGILSLDDGVASTALALLGLDRIRTAKSITESLGPPRWTLSVHEIPYGRQVFLTVKHAMTLAHRDGIRPHSGHLLIACVKSENDPAAGWGLVLEEVQRVVSLAASEPEE